MIARSGWLSVVVVAVLALGLSFKADGLVVARDFDGLVRLCRCAREGLSALGRTADRALASGASAQVAGPTYLLVVYDGSVIGLDRLGRVSFRDTTYDCCDFPVLTGVAVDVGAPGSAVASPEVALAFAIIRAFEQSPELLEALSEVNIGCLESPRAILSGGAVVELGRGDYGGKVARLAKVVKQVSNLELKPELIDLRFGRQVAVRLAEPQHSSKKEV